jgi:hypothetical protein
MLVYFMDSWSVLQPLGTLYGHLLYFVAVRYIFPRFGMLLQEKIWQPWSTLPGIFVTCGAPELFLPFIQYSLRLI